MRVTSGEVREVCAATVSGALMYFNGLETEELCTKLDADRRGECRRIRVFAAPRGSGSQDLAGDTA